MQYRLVLTLAFFAIFSISPASAIHINLALPRLDIPSLRRLQNTIFPAQAGQQSLDSVARGVNSLLNLEAIMPLPSSSAPDEAGPVPSPDPGNGNGPIVSDVLPKTRGINIFASLTRDFESVASRLNDASKNVTVLAPRNSAIQDLPRKPWESPEDYEQHGQVEAYQGQEGQERAKRNLRRFVEAHLVPTSPWKEGEETETLGGGKVRWIREGDKFFIQPGKIEVDSVAERVSNGEVWILDGVINYI